MKVAIQQRNRSFTDRWVKFCLNNQIEFMAIDVFSNDIIDQFKRENVTHFLWHINHSSTKELMVFPYVMNSLEEMGVKCFPNFNSRWHFDDKIAQKYILESIEAPLVPSHVFYEKSAALHQISKVNFPIVAKLKRGAGASNVKLIKDKTEAGQYIEKMFGVGINPSSGTLGNFGLKTRLAKKIKNPFKLFQKVYSHFISSYREQKALTFEKGYFYYQEFLPNNPFDIRVIVIGDRAFAIKRINRENDFRASGSGKVEYSREQIDERCVEISLDVSRRLNHQCMGYDFVFDQQGNPLIIEMGFGFSIDAYNSCEGYWTSDMKWHNEKFDAAAWMLEDLLNS